MRIKAKYIALIFLTSVLSQTALSGESYCGRYKLFSEFKYSRDGYISSVSVTDTLSGEVLIAYSSEDGEYADGYWITNDEPTVAIVRFESPVGKWHENKPPFFEDKHITRQGDTVTYTNCGFMHMIYLYYPDTKEKEYFGKFFIGCDYELNWIDQVSSSTRLFICSGNPSFTDYLYQLDKGDTSLTFVGLSEIWGPLSDGRYLIRSGPKVLWDWFPATTYQISFWGPDERKSENHNIADSSTVFLITEEAQLVVAEKVRQVSVDSAFIESMDYPFEDSILTYGFLIKLLDLNSATFETLGYLYLGDVRGKRGWVTRFNSVTCCNYPILANSCSLDYFEVIDTFFLDLEPRLVYDTIGAVEEFVVDTFYRHTTMKFDSRLFIDLENEPHLRTRRLGIHEDDKNRY